MPKKLQFAVILHPEEEGGWWVEVPSLPGCVSQGETAREALSNIKEAIELTLEDMLANNESVPPERQEGHTVTVQLPVPAV